MQCVVLRGTYLLLNELKLERHRESPRTHWWLARFAFLFLLFALKLFHERVRFPLYVASSPTLDQ
jgi:hypothetical protein